MSLRINDECYDNKVYIIGYNVMGMGIVWMICVCSNRKVILNCLGLVLLYICVCFKYLLVYFLIGNGVYII